MDFKSTLKKGCFAVELKSDTKEGVIREMIDMLDAAGKLPDKNVALNSVLDREKKMSTGMQCGVAIPHGKTDSIDDLLVAFAMKKDGVEFGSLDGQPAKIFVMTISSSNRTGPHIQYLAEISKVLNVPSIRERLLASTSIDEVIAILAGGPYAAEPAR